MLCFWRLEKDCKSASFEACSGDSAPLDVVAGGAQPQRDNEAALAAEPTLLATGSSGLCGDDNEVELATELTLQPEEKKEWDGLVDHPSGAALPENPTKTLRLQPIFVGEETQTDIERLLKHGL